MADTITDTVDHLTHLPRVLLKYRIKPDASKTIFISLWLLLYSLAYGYSEGFVASELIFTEVKEIFF